MSGLIKKVAVTPANHMHKHAAATPKQVTRCIIPNTLRGSVETFWKHPKNIARSFNRLWYRSKNTPGTPKHAIRSRKTFGDLRKHSIETPTHTMHTSSDRTHCMTHGNNLQELKEHLQEFPHATGTQNTLEKQWKHAVTTLRSRTMDLLKQPASCSRWYRVCIKFTKRAAKITSVAQTPGNLLQGPPKRCRNPENTLWESPKSTGEIPNGGHH